MARGVLEPSYRKRVGYQSMLLGGIATLASALLVLGDMRTSGPIAERRAEDLRASLNQVLPEALYDNDLLADAITLPGEGGAERIVYVARKGGEVSGVAFEIVGQGYAGAVTSVMGIDRDGHILGVRVINHAETPGLGDKIEAARSNWVLSFNGHTLDEPQETGWHVKKDGGIFDQFTGATITPRAVVKSVHEGLQYYVQHRSEILQARPAAMQENKDEQ